MTFAEILETSSVLPLGNLKKDKSLMPSNEKLEKPIEQIAKIRLCMLNSGNKIHENKYFSLEFSGYPNGGLLIITLNIDLPAVDSIIS